MPRNRAITLILLVVLLALAAIGVWWLSLLVRELVEPASQAGNHDFLAFYSAGELVRQGHASGLYSATALTPLERAIYPLPTGYQGYLPFLNPPSAAAILAPLSVLPFGVARFTWLGISVVCAVWSIVILGRGMSMMTGRVAVCVLALASYPAYQTMAEGQWSFVLLLAILLSMRNHQQGRPVLAGVLLSALWLKPPLLILVIAWLAFRRQGRVLGGLVVGLALITVITLPWTGVTPYLEYFKYSAAVLASHGSGGGALVANGAWQGALPNMEGLLGLSATLAGQSNPAATDVLFLTLSGVVVGVFLISMRGGWRASEIRVDLVVAALALGILLDVHAYAQDCLLLASGVFVVLQARRGPTSAKLWTARWGRAQQLVAVIAGISLLDLSAFDANWIGVGGFRPIHLVALVLVGCVVGSAVVSVRRSPAAAGLEAVQA